MFQALALAFLALSGSINIHYILCLSLLKGIVNAFDIPARQVFIAEMVPKADLSSAIAVNAAIISAARLMGPAIAGLLIAAFNSGLCFLINGISYIAVIIALLAMDIAWKPPHPPTSGPWQRLKEGWVYSFKYPSIRAILLLLALVSFMGVPYTSLIPIFAKDIMKGNSETHGFLLAFAGVGSLAGSLYLSFQKSLSKLKEIWISFTLFLGIALVIFSQSRILWMSFGMMFIIGCCLVIQVAASNILLQAVVPNDKRGRIMSLFTLAYIGMVPFGNLFVGEIATRIGAPWALTINGCFCILGVFVVNKQVRNISFAIK
jgi:MFS family permease